MVSRFLCSLLLVPLCLLLTTRPGLAQAAEERSLSISGTLSFFGCAPDLEDFTIVGVRLRADAIAESRRDDPTGEPEIIIGSLSRTDDAQTFALSLPAVQSDAAYQLRVGVSEGRENPCGRVFWEGPEQGIAFPGKPVRLVGYAPRAAIEVMDTPRPGEPRRGWVGADNIDVHDPLNAIRRFRWFTQVPGVTAGLVQVATERFPKDSLEGRTCGAAAGVLYEASFQARSGAWNLLPPLNLAAVARQILSHGPNGAAKYDLFTFGAPLYVRVLPIVDDKIRCRPREDGPAPWVVLAKLAKGLAPAPGGTTANSVKAPMALTALSHHMRPWISASPQGSQTLYRTTKPHLIPHDILTNVNGFFTDPYAYMMAKHIPALFKPGEVAPAGSMFLLWPGSGGFDIFDVFEGAVSIVTGVVDAVGLLVTEVSKAYDSIKAAVANVITSAISATGLVNCKTSQLCQELVATAISTGLMAAGLPPSLPNWNAVVDHGYEYLAAEVVSQAGASSVPGAQELTKAAVKALVEEAVNQMTESRGGGGGLPEWLTVEIGQEPPVLILQLLTTPDASMDPLFPDRLVISSNAVTLGTTVKVPSVWTSADFVGAFSTLKIPIVLKPNLVGFTPPVGILGAALSSYETALAAKKWWGQKLQLNPCVSTTLSLGKKIAFATLTTHTLPTLSYDPADEVWFNPIYQHCIP